MTTHYGFSGRAWCGARDAYDITCERKRVSCSGCAVLHDVITLGLRALRRVRAA